MLFCLSAEYTPQALNAMRENPNPTGERQSNSCSKLLVESLSPCMAGPVMAPA